MNSTTIIHNLTVARWNCNSIKAHKPEITQLLTKNHNFICLNETKLSDKDIINFPNYNISRKDRNIHGGGVAILTRTDMEIERVDTLDNYGHELIAIKVKLKSSFIHLICIYIPPRKTSQDKFLTQQFFDSLTSLEPFILCRDLNSHSTAWHCRILTLSGGCFFSFSHNKVLRS